MARRLLAALCVTAVAFVLTARADSPKPDPIKIDPAKGKTTGSSDVKYTPKQLELEQIQLKQQFVEFKTSLLRLAQNLELSNRPENKEKAKMLRDAIAQAGKIGTDAKFTRLIELLRSPKIVDDLDKLTLATDVNEALRRDLQTLLKILLSDNRSAILAEERKRMEKMLEQLKEAIRKQERLRTQTEQKRDKPEELARKQETVTTLTKNLIGKGKGAKGAEGKQGEAKGNKGDGKEGKEGRGEAKKDTIQDKTGKKGDGKAADKEGKKGDGKGEPKDGKPGEGKKGAGKDGKGEPKDGKGQGKDGKPGEGKKGEGKPGADKDGKGKPGEGKKDGQDKKPGSGEKKPAQAKDGKPAAGKQGEPKQGKPGDGKPGEGKPGKPGDGKPAKGGESKGKGDGKGESKGESKAGSGKPSKGQPSQGKSGGKPGKPGEGKPGKPGKPQDQPPAEQNPARKQIEDATKKQDDAQKKLETGKPEQASGDQDDAIAELKKAQKKLEELLRQIREEEIERLLAALQQRCEDMLRMQIGVYDGTVDVYNRIKDKKMTREQRQRAADLGVMEDDIVKLANVAIRLVEEEGSAVAFAEVFKQVREDMVKVARRLGKQNDVGPFTQTVERYIIETLREMIEALKKARKDNKKPPKPGKPGQSGKPPEQDLIDLLAELKMIRAMQVRVNRQTADYHKFYPDLEQAPDPVTIKDVKQREQLESLQDELKDLGERQKKIERITKDLGNGKNKTRD